MANSMYCYEDTATPHPRPWSGDSGLQCAYSTLGKRATGYSTILFKQLYQCISPPSIFGNVHNHDIPATSMSPHRQLDRYTGVSRACTLDHNLHGKIPNGNFVFLSVIRCQVACAFRGVNTCDGIVQGCIRERHESMVQGASRVPGQRRKTEARSP